MEQGRSHVQSQTITANLPCLSGTAAIWKPVKACLMAVPAVHIETENIKKNTSSRFEACSNTYQQFGDWKHIICLS